MTGSDVDDTLIRHCNSQDEFLTITDCRDKTHNREWQLGHRIKWQSSRNVSDKYKPRRDRHVQNESTRINLKFLT